MKKWITLLVFVLLLAFISLSCTSCGTATQMKRVDKELFQQKKSKDSKKIDRQNKRKYKYSKI